MVNKIESVRSGGSQLCDLSKDDDFKYSQNSGAKPGSMLGGRASKKGFDMGSRNASKLSIGSQFRNNEEMLSEIDFMLTKDAFGASK